MVSIFQSLWLNVLVSVLRSRTLFEKKTIDVCQSLMLHIGGLGMGPITLPSKMYESLITKRNKILRITGYHYCRTRLHPGPGWLGYCVFVCWSWARHWCQYHIKFMVNSIENMHTDVRVLSVNPSAPEGVHLTDSPFNFDTLSIGLVMRVNLGKMWNLRNCSQVTFDRSISHSGKESTIFLVILL